METQTESKINMSNDNSVDTLKSLVLENLKKTGCFLQGDFTLKSGKKSNFYLNLRHLVNTPHLIRDISDVIKHYLPNDKFLLCGLPYAGIPYTMAVSILYDIPSIILRKQQKSHGLNNWIDGLEKTDIRKVVLIEDIISTGSSIESALPILEQHGLEVVKVICIVDRREPEIKEAKKELDEKIGLVSLFTLDNFLD